MLGWVVIAVALLGFGPAPGDAHVLDVPYRSQLDGSAYALANCGPTSLAMVLAYYSIDASPWDLRVKAMKFQHSWVGDDGGYSDSYGVFVYNLASVAETMGVHATGLWRREGARDDRVREWQASDLRREILNDRPVIVQVEYRSLPRRSGSASIDDHYVVVHGVMGGDFVYSDPLGSTESGANQIISEHDLMAAMGQASTPRAGFAVSKANSSSADGWLTRTLD